ncbi:unnamed protein product [Linum tenue]|uniref:Uncharacterized protein n=1 Tax=Linum tenue TaxID=586396 RepID=A0AAV0H9P4_9ROSI|nr:unnamed protein product [Linum tenue]
MMKQQTAAAAPPLSTSAATQPDPHTSTFCKTAESNKEREQILECQILVCY